MARSRDNLPNPQQGNDGDADDYVPRNMPAIGDLFDLFHFDNDEDNAAHRVIVLTALRAFRALPRTCLRLTRSGKSVYLRN